MNRAGRIFRQGVVMLALLLVAASCGGTDSVEGAVEGDVEGAVDTKEDAAETAVDTATDAAPTDDASSTDEDPAPTDDGSNTEDDTGATDDASSTEEDAAAGDSDSECPATTASWRGVTEDTISIGVSMIDFEYLKDNGFSPFGWGDQQLAWQNAIDDINERGGIYCRQLEGVFAFYSPVGTTDAEAKCLELTADSEVFIVMFGFVGPAEPANTCIVGQQETALLGGRITAERLDQAKAPWIQLNATGDRKIETLVGLLEDAGEIDGKTLAIISAPQTADAHQLAIDEFTAAGANVAVELVTDSPVADTVAEDAEWGVLNEVLQGAGVDTVFFNATVAAGLRNMTAAGYTPAVWTSDDDGLNNLGASVSPEMADGILTVAELTDDERWLEPGIVACTESLAARHPDVATSLVAPTDREGEEEAWFNAVISSCSRMSMLEQLLLEAGPDLTYDSLNTAIESIGDFAVPGSPFNSLGGGKLDASDTFRLGRFNAALGDSGEIEGIGPAIDATP